MRKAILGGVLTVAALVVILMMQGVSLHGMLGDDDDDDDDNPGALRALFHLDEFATLTGSAASPISGTRPTVSATAAPRASRSRRSGR